MTEGLHVNISNHFYYNDFGIRDYSEMRYGGRRFVMTGTPGTGFIERESESHSYHQFVRNLLAKQKPSYWRMLMGKEPNFDKALAEANKAMVQSSDKYKRDLLECYVNALTVARNEERIERVVRGIKDKMGHHSNKFMVSVMSHYKSKIRQMEHDMLSVIWHVKDHCSEETYKAYCKVVDEFTRVASCRRIWFLENSRKGYQQVFDFDVVPLKTLTIVSQELAIEEANESMLGRLGDAASMIKIPEFDLTFYFNHVRAIVDFVHSVDCLKETL